jgi:alcohol dehydrogenase
VTPFDTFLPTRFLFGPGRLEALGTTPYLPGKRALVVIGSGGAMVSSGYLQRVKELLRRNGVSAAVFDRIRPNPESQQIEDGADVFRSSRCDFTLGLGGGSSLDAAKSIAFMAANPGHYWDYMVRGSGGRRAPGRPAHPIVAIPTTAGTGSEADPWTVVSKSGGKEKAGWGHDSTFPCLSIIDPELTFTLPPEQTAYTGLDALLHAVEAVLSRAAQPLSDLLALDAIARIRRDLPGAVHRSDDITCRCGMSMAALEAGVCEALTGVISLHAMGLALGGLFPGVAHGAALVSLAPAYFKFLEAAAPDRFGRLAIAMAGGWTGGRGGKESFTQRLERLIAESGLAGTRLGAFGVSREDVPALVENTFQCAGAHFERTPAAMGADDVDRIFRGALDEEP